MSFRVTAAGLNARMPQNIVDMLSSDASAASMPMPCSHIIRGCLAQACGLKVTLAPEGEARYTAR